MADYFIVSVNSEKQNCLSIQFSKKFYISIDNICFYSLGLFNNINKKQVCLKLYKEKISKSPLMILNTEE